MGIGCWEQEGKSFYQRRKFLFGKIRFTRHYFYASGHGGLCPLGAGLSLPPHCYSDLLCDWAEYCVTDEAYDESIKVLDRILGLSLQTTI